MHRRVPVQVREFRANRQYPCRNHREHQAADRGILPGSRNRHQNRFLPGPCRSMIRSTSAASAARIRRA
jgi:hypothetical protein